MQATCECVCVCVWRVDNASSSFFRPCNLHQNYHTYILQHLHLFLRLKISPFWFLKPSYSKTAEEIRQFNIKFRFLESNP